MLQDVFVPISQLHLVIWNRINESDHDEEMNHIAKIFGEESFKSTLLMMRPLGRPVKYYQHYSTKFDAADIQALGQVETLYGSRTSHAELWVQVADRVDTDIRKELKTGFGSIPSSCLFWHSHYPTWQPFETKFSSDIVTTRPGPTKDFVDSLSEVQAAWFLKGIWHRATKAIVDRIDSGGTFKRIDPIQERQQVYEFMNDILNDIDPNELGLQSKNHQIDPSAIGASHMPAFAINMMTRSLNSKRYGIEDYYNDLADGNTTRPGNFQSRESFLSQFR